MDILASMHALGHEQVLLSHDPSCGYFGIIAIHDTTLGPALGGTRFWRYASTEEAITDALRLSRGMTYKSAVAGINLGGGKSVIVGANNQLAEDRHGDLLEHRGLLYAPDYVINGGGVINVYGELHRWPVERAKKKAGEIYDTLLRIFEIAKRERMPTYRAADRLAE